MAVHVTTAAFYGIDGVIVSVEIDISNGLPSFNIVGLADISVKESKERVRSAIINSGFDFPVNRITVNLAPADLRKEGSQFDLPIAIGILVATNQIKIDDLDSYLFMGELSLSGDLKKVKGALPIVIEGVNNNINNFIVPAANEKECYIVRNSNIYSFENLTQVAAFLENKDLLPFSPSEKNVKTDIVYYNDFEDVLGQESTKRAVEIAAAGGHNILLFGPPGSGKSMIANRIPSILPKLSYKEALEVTKIYSVSGNLRDEGLMKNRPFRSPHHTSSNVALVGGGRNLSPGEISLAHNGVLFLDELLEFKRNVLEVLRQPLEDRKITISRAMGSITYPANFILVAALNPCPCGFYGSNIKECTCTEYERKKYLSRLSGPLLDRLDIFTYVTSLSYKEINDDKKGESSASIRKRVEAAREIQKNRFIKDNIYCNAEMDQKLIKKYCKVSKKGLELLEKVYEKYHLSNRAYSRILKLSRTIADLNGSECIENKDVIEAIQYRKFLNENIV